MEDLWWKESSGDARHTDKHCENLMSDLFRVASDVRPHDEALYEKLMLPFRSLQSEEYCIFEDSADRFYYQCGDLQYDLISNAMDEIVTHTDQDYLPGDQVNQAIHEIADRMDHCVKSFAEEVEDEDASLSD